MVNVFSLPEDTAQCLQFHLPFERERVGWRFPPHSSPWGFSLDYLHVWKWHHNPAFKRPQESSCAEEMQWEGWWWDLQILAFDVFPLMSWCWGWQPLKSLEIPLDFTETGGSLWELEYTCDVWNDFPITLTLHPHPWERTLGWLFLGQWSRGLTGS